MKEQLVKIDVKKTKFEQDLKQVVDSLWEEYEMTPNSCENYEKPSNVVGVLVEPISGKPATDQDKNVKLMYFLKGTEPKGDEPVFDEIEKK